MVPKVGVAVPAAWASLFMPTLFDGILGRHVLLGMCRARKGKSGPRWIIKAGFMSWFPVGLKDLG